MDVFYCGTQAMDWTCYNCDQCKKGPDQNTLMGQGEKGGVNDKCDIENAVAEGFMFGNERITEDIAKRMGAGGSYNWRCPEFEQKELKMDNKTRQVRFNAKYVAVLAEFMGKSDIRYYLNGAFVTPHNENGVLLVATDGHTMAIIHDHEGETNGDHIFPLSKPLIAATKKRAPCIGKPEAVELIGEAAYVRQFKEDLAYDPAISSMDVHVEHCPPIEGKYPDIRRVIPIGEPIPSLITINPEYIARFAKVKKIMGSRCMGASFFTYGKREGTLIRLSELPEALFIIMPMTAGSELLAPVEDWLRSWVKSGEENKQETSGEEK